MTKKVPFKRIGPDEARLYMGKAEEHLDAAKDNLAVGRWTAATTLAVHAGINAADAITGARLGKRASGAQHEQVLTLLKDVPEADRARRYLRPLLATKPRAEYDPTQIRERPARRSVEQAEELVSIARTVIESVSRPPRR
ncbi:MAG: HEPN domain-containing protein [Candidatus Binatia bacterium]